ncbi:MAG: hypothetical protein EB072_09320, partial [Betaproteobacteria bacterium]|nr:hypothetical protein [Betaproteobacteria bacterium]
SQSLLDRLCENAMKTQASRRPRNPIAKAVRTPRYKMRVVENQRRKLLEKWAQVLLKNKTDD